MTVPNPPPTPPPNPVVPVNVPRRAPVGGTDYRRPSTPDRETENRRDNASIEAVNHVASVHGSAGEAQQPPEQDVTVEGYGVFVSTPERPWPGRPEFGGDAQQTSEETL